MTQPDAAARPSTLTLTTLDGVVLTIPCQPGMTVLKASVVAGRRLPCLCWQGACGICWATHTGGEVQHAAYSPQAMGPMAGEHGVLLCRTTPLGDCSFDLPYEANRIVDSHPPVRRAAVTKLEPVGRDVMRLVLRFEPDDVHGSAAQFDPGQFMQIEVPRPPGSPDPGPYPPSRAYSMANCGNWDGDLEFYVHVQDGGEFSTYLRERAEVGDVLTLHGPQGGFGLRERGLRPRWFVAGGTGLAPLLSMIRRMAEWGDPQPVRLCVGFTTSARVFATDSLTELAATLPEFSATLCLWKPESETAAEELAAATGLSVVTGTPAEALAKDLETAPVTPDVYVCGPPRWCSRSRWRSPRRGWTPSTSRSSGSRRAERAEVVGPRRRGPPPACAPSEHGAFSDSFGHVGPAHGLGPGVIRTAPTTGSTPCHTERTPAWPSWRLSQRSRSRLRWRRPPRPTPAVPRSRP